MPDYDTCDISGPRGFLQRRTTTTTRCNLSWLVAFNHTCVLTEEATDPNSMNCFPFAPVSLASSANFSKDMKSGIATTGLTVFFQPSQQ